MAVLVLFHWEIFYCEELSQMNRFLIIVNFSTLQKDHIEDIKVSVPLLLLADQLICQLRVKSHIQRHSLFFVCETKSHIFTHN